MDISRVISIVRTLKEQPENSTGSTAGTNPTAGFSQNSNAAGPTAGYDKRLFPAAIDDLSQDYQSPGQTGLAVWRFSNVYPVQKLGDGGVDSMVDASKEYMQMSDNSNSSNYTLNTQCESSLSSIPHPKLCLPKYISNNRNMCLSNEKDKTFIDSKGMRQIFNEKMTQSGFAGKWNSYLGQIEIPSQFNNQCEFT